MPVHRGRDKDGCYYRYGSTGHKYYYICGDPITKKIAKALSDRQARAINAGRPHY